MQKYGLEWFWRLLHEPSRLWKRYLVRDLPFFYHILKQRLTPPSHAAVIPEPRESLKNCCRRRSCASAPLSEPAGRKGSVAGAVEFVTQDESHRIYVTSRTLNGNYSKTFSGLNMVNAETADTSRVMLIQNYTNNATYRSTCGFYNPTADSVMVEYTLLDLSGTPIGNSFIKTLSGHDFQAFSPFVEAGEPYPGSSHDNVILRARPISGTGTVICFGASANNASNDPASHLAVQGN